MGLRISCNCTADANDRIAIDESRLISACLCCVQRSNNPFNVIRSIQYLNNILTARGHFGVNIFGVRQVGTPIASYIIVVEGRTQIVEFPMTSQGDSFQCYTLLHASIPSHTPGSVVHDLVIRLIVRGC